MRTERYQDGTLVEVIELFDQSGVITFRHIVDGSVVEERSATVDEQEVFADGEKQQRIDTIQSQFPGAVRTLRTWANQAQNTNVTNQNAVATLQIVVDRLGLFFDRFADLLVLLDRADVDDFE